MDGSSDPSACRHKHVALRPWGPQRTSVSASLAQSGSFGLGPPSSSCVLIFPNAFLWLGLYAVKVRAEAMQEASEAVPSGMLSVLGQPQSKFNFACLEARKHCTSLGIESPVCEVASYLFPDCRVISGHLEVGVDGNHLHGSQASRAGGRESLCTREAPMLQWRPGQAWSGEYLAECCRGGVRRLGYSPLHPSRRGPENIACM